MGWPRNDTYMAFSSSWMSLSSCTDQKVALKFMGVDVSVSLVCAWIIFEFLSLSLSLCIGESCWTVYVLISLCWRDQWWTKKFKKLVPMSHLRRQDGLSSIGFSKLICILMHQFDKDAMKRKGFCFICEMQVLLIGLESGKEKNHTPLNCHGGNRIKRRKERNFFWRMIYRWITMPYCRCNEAISRH